MSKDDTIIEEIETDDKPSTTKDTLLTYNGITMTISAWAKQTHISTICLIKRKDADWDVERILTERPPSKSSKTICWNCARSAGYMGGCNWSNYCIGKSDIPEVEGWVAERKHNENLYSAKPNTSDELRFNDGGLTFTVKSCPEFIPDEDVVISFSM